MYMYQLEHGARMYNIYIYAYVLIGTWYIHVHCTTSAYVPTGTRYIPVQHQHTCICNVVLHLNFTSTCTIPSSTVRPINIYCKDDC